MTPLAGVREFLIPLKKKKGRFPVTPYMIYLESAFLKTNQP